MTEKEREMNRMEKKMLVDGMMCEHCKMKVEKALKSVDGVEDAVVDLAAKTATIQLSGDTDDQALMDAVAAKGFTPVKMI